MAAYSFDRGFVLAALLGKRVTTMNLMLVSGDVQECLTIGYDTAKVLRVFDGGFFHRDFLPCGEGVLDSLELIWLGKHLDGVQFTPAEWAGCWHGQNETV